MSEDHITKIKVEGLRSLSRIDLDVSALTVLVGENGSGKSSLVEACEILRRAAGANFYEEFTRSHGGLEELVTVGEDGLTLGVRIEGGGEPLEYEFSLAPVPGGIIRSEDLWMLGPSSERTSVIHRTVSGTEIATADATVRPPNGNFGGAVLAISRFGDFPPHPAIGRVVAALAAIEVHVPFDVGPAWLYRSLRRVEEIRREVSPAHVTRLERMGINLVNAFKTLQSEFGRGHWEETMDIVRLGLGDDIEELVTRTRPGSVGTHGLWIKYRCFDRLLPSVSLSDGSLTYLAFVAMYRLGAPGSLLVFDEPELHLHPQLLVRVLDFFKDIATDRPVVIATHSDRLLDALNSGEAARSVVLCELDSERRTHLLRPNAEALHRWLERYRGLGDLRSSGYERAVMTQEIAS